MKNVAKTAFVFPGQGSQTLGMGKDFAENPTCRELFERADEAISFNLSKLMWGEDAQTLTQTENAQPALLVCGLVALEYLRSQSGLSLNQMAAAVAGHSLGEYTAVAAAGGLSFEKAVQLVRLRGQAMKDCDAEGSMSAILGLSPQQAEDVAAATNVTFANDNAEGQSIFSGPLQALAKAEEAAKAAGAKRALRLPVSGPFHTAALAPAAQKVEQFLTENPLQPLLVPCVMNATAQPFQTPQEVAQGLVQQVTSRVRWRESMLHLAETGTEHIVELGTGKVLTGLAPRCDTRLQAQPLTTRAEADAYLASL